MPDTRRYATPAWELEVPAGILGRAVDPPADSPYDSMFILRGWLHDTAPATLVVTTRPRKGATLRSEMRRLGAGFREPPGDGTPIDVAGAHGARRIDGTIDLGEGVSEDGVDRVATVVAVGRRALVLLSIRTRPAGRRGGGRDRAHDPLADRARRLAGIDRSSWMPRCRGRRQGRSAEHPQGGSLRSSADRSWR